MAKKSKRLSFIRICAYSKCGKEFAPRAGNQQYCSVRCQLCNQAVEKKLQIALREAERKEEKLRRICENPKCFKEFIASRGNQRYCCEACSKHVQYLAKKQRDFEARNNPSAKYKPRGTKPRISLAEANALARAEGLSYGRYYNKYGYDGWF